MKINLALLSLVLLISTISAVIPSESAIDAASGYLRQGEQASIVNRPYLVDGKQYFVVYFHPETNQEVKNLVVVIDADSGELVKDERVLSKVYAFDAKLSFLENFIAENTLSFQDLKTAVEGGRNTREQAQDSLNTVEDNLVNVEENIATVQTSFSQFTLSIERLDEDIDGGLDIQDLFEREYSDTALDGLTIRYNSTLKILVETVNAGEDYQKAVINKSNELTQKGVEQNLFKPGLQAAFNIGLERFSSRTSLENAHGEFNNINSLQSQRQVNDSIRSYLYRKEKVESDAAVESIKPSVEEILRRRSEVAECTGVSALENAWQNALRAQQSNQFVQVQGNVTLVENELNKIRDELESCNPTPSQPTNQNDNTNIFVGVILLLVIGYFVWKMSGKKPEQPQQETGKANLFG